VTQQADGPIPEMAPRIREFPYSQLPFLAGVAVLLVFVLAGAPDALLETGFQVGVGLTVAATLSGIVVPWQRYGHQWLVLVPLVDVVAVAFLRDGVRDVFAAVGMLVVLPVLWLAYGFAWWALGLALAGAVVVSSFPLVQSGSWPTDVAGWGTALLLPIITAFIAVTARVAANGLRAQQRELVTVSHELRAALLEATDRQATFVAVMETVDAGIELYNARGEVVLSNAAGRALAERAGSTTGAFGKGIPLHGAGRIYWMGDDDQSAILASAGTVQRDSGFPLGAVVVATDVTPLVEAIAVRDDFLATVSHELRTPLTSIIGYLGLIDAEELGIAMEVGVIERNAERLLSVISHLLSATDGQPAIHRVDTDLSALIRSRVDTATAMARSAGIALCITPASALRADVDPAAVEQVLDNLLTNAIKFGSVTGTVTLSVETDGADAVLRVADDGIGLSAEDQRQVFDRFFRARNSAELAIPGMGLGLAIVRAIVTAHQGTVDLASTLGEGTTVTVRLPLRAAPGAVT
jgi:two-component system phosphate regulon sensor histidine kinase PhoR